ncbi:MAG: signal peptidase I [Dehalococcoidales bacterium]|nr:signal peptidase I [Dehalococcoidales bacterium]
MRAYFRQILVVVLIAVGIFFLLQVTIQSFVVVGSSMMPSYEDGQRLLVNKVFYRFGEPEMGDVIVFHPPTSRRVDYIKRIIAGPGDTVEIEGGMVYVNDVAISEPYIRAHPSYTVSQKRVPENEYFVLGDNRNNSNDSHSGWTVEREDIIGKVWISIWPPGLIPDYNLEEQLTTAKLLPQLPQAEMNHGRSPVRAAMGNSCLLQLPHHFTHLIIS